GIVVFLLVLAVERRLGIGFGFFSTAWAVVITVALTRLICSRISHERPLSAVMTMCLRELTAPREKTSATRAAATAARIRVNSQRPRPKKTRQRSRGRQRRARYARQPGRTPDASPRQRAREVRGVRWPARPRAELSTDAEPVTRSERVGPQEDEAASHGRRRAGDPHLHAFDSGSFHRQPSAADLAGRVCLV